MESNETERASLPASPGSATVEELRIEAMEWVEKHGASGLMGPFPNRSCWNCNSAHEWMKTDMETPYQCFGCGHTYFKGVRLTEDAI